MKKVVLLLVSTVLFFSLVQAQEVSITNMATSGIKPTYLQIQFAGNLGLVSAGAGYVTENEKFQYGFNYGYLPESVSGSAVHTVSGKGAWNFKHFVLREALEFVLYAGTNLILL